MPYKDKKKSQEYRKGYKAGRRAERRRWKKRKHGTPRQIGKPFPVKPTSGAKYQEPFMRVYVVHHEALRPLTDEEARKIYRKADERARSVEIPSGAEVDELAEDNCLGN